MKNEDQNQDKNKIQNKEMQNRKKNKTLTDINKISNSYKFLNLKLMDFKPSLINRNNLIKLCENIKEDNQKEVCNQYNIILKESKQDNKIQQQNYKNKKLEEYYNSFDFWKETKTDIIYYDISVNLPLTPKLSPISSNTAKIPKKESIDILSTEFENIFDIQQKIIKIKKYILKNFNRYIDKLVNNIEIDDLQLYNILKQYKQFANFDIVINKQIIFNNNKLLNQDIKFYEFDKLLNKIKTSLEQDLNIFFLSKYCEGQTGNINTYIDKIYSDILEKFIINIFKKTPQIFNNYISILKSFNNFLNEYKNIIINYLEKYCKMEIQYYINQSVIFNSIKKQINKTSRIQKKSMVELIKSEQDKYIQFEKTTTSKNGTSNNELINNEEEAINQSQLDEKLYDNTAILDNENNFDIFDDLLKQDNNKIINNKQSPFINNISIVPNNHRKNDKQSYNSQQELKTKKKNSCNGVNNISTSNNNFFDNYHSIYNICNDTNEHTSQNIHANNTQNKNLFLGYKIMKVIPINLINPSFIQQVKQLSNIKTINKSDTDDTQNDFYQEFTPKFSCSGLINLINQLDNIYDEIIKIPYYLVCNTKVICSEMLLSFIEQFKIYFILLVKIYDDKLYAKYNDNSKDNQFDIDHTLKILCHLIFNMQKLFQQTEILNNTGQKSDYCKIYNKILSLKKDIQHIFIEKTQKIIKFIELKYLYQLEIQILNPLITNYYLEESINKTFFEQINKDNTSQIKQINEIKNTNKVSQPFIQLKYNLNSLQKKLIKYLGEPKFSIISFIIQSNQLKIIFRQTSSCLSSIAVSRGRYENFKIDLKYCINLFNEYSEESFNTLINLISYKNSNNYFNFNHEQNSQLQIEQFVLHTEMLETISQLNHMQNIITCDSQQLVKYIDRLNNQTINSDNYFLNFKHIQTVNNKTNNNIIYTFYSNKQYTHIPKIYYYNDYDIKNTKIDDAFNIDLSNDNKNDYSTIGLIDINLVKFNLIDKEIINILFLNNSIEKLFSLMKYFENQTFSQFNINFYKNLNDDINPNAILNNILKDNCINNQITEQPILSQIDKLNEVEITKTKIKNNQISFNKQNLNNLFYEKSKQQKYQSFKSGILFSSKKLKTKKITLSHKRSPILYKYIKNNKNNKQQSFISFLKYPRKYNYKFYDKLSNINKINQYNMYQIITNKRYELTNDYYPYLTEAEINNRKTIIKKLKVLFDYFHIKYEQYDQIDDKFILNENNTCIFLQNDDQ